MAFNLVVIFARYQYLDQYHTNIDLNTPLFYNCAMKHVFHATSHASIRIAQLFIPCNDRFLQDIVSQTLMLTLANTIRKHTLSIM